MQPSIFSIKSSLVCYPEDCVSDAIEIDIAATLPVLASLAPGMTDTQRLATFQSEVLKSRAAFCEIYGDPFGCIEVVVHAETAHSEALMDAVSLS